MGERRNWTREETILAFELYCRTPFGKIHKNNPDVIELAHIIGRTPDAVGLKMANLGGCDPALKARNIKGMAHGSKMDARIFEEFYRDIGELEVQAKRLRSKMLGVEDDLETVYEDIKDWPAGEYKDRIIKTRLGQSFFRTSVLNTYEHRCCITGMKESSLLIASHIKPWAVSDERTERTNPCNGLCLNAFHDRAFDQGLITLDDKYQIVISKRLKDTEMDLSTREWFLSYQGKSIILPERFIPGKEFIEYHNDMIFMG